MARLYTIAKGGRVADVREAPGTPISGGNAVDVNIDFGADFSRRDAVHALEAVIRYITQNRWPPAPAS